MLRSTHFAFLALAALLAAGCGPTLKPAMKASIDTRVAALQQRDEVFPAPTGNEPPALQVGTWATYKLTDADGEPSLLTYKVLRQQGDRYWLETVSETYYGRTVQLMRVGFGDRKSPEDIDVDRLFQKQDDGDIQEFPENLLGMMVSLYKPLLARLSIAWTGLPQEDVTVPAGTFEQAYKMRVESSFVGFSETSDVWYHDAAPVGGTVKSQSVDSGSSMVLVETGTDPEPEIPLP